MQCFDFIVLYRRASTDTIWGLGCDALDEKAVENIFAIKQRPKEKSLIVLLPEARDVLQYVAAPHPDIIAIIESFDIKQQRWQAAADASPTLYQYLKDNIYTNE